MGDRRIDKRLEKELEARREKDEGVRYSSMTDACPQEPRVYLPGPDAPHDVEAIPAGSAILGVAASDGDPSKIKIYIERPGENPGAHNLTDRALYAWSRMYEAFLFRDQPDLLGTVDPLVPVRSFQEDPEEWQVPRDALIDVGSFHAGQMRMTIESDDEGKVAEWLGHRGPDLPVSELSESQAWRLEMEAEGHTN